MRLRVPADFPIPASEAQSYLDAMEKTPSGQSAGPSMAWMMDSPYYRTLDFTPPAVVRKNALEGLRLRFTRHRPGGTPIGYGRAVQLALGLPVPPRDLRRMAAFRRHYANAHTVRAREDKTPAHVAWMLWGGDEGIDWADWMLGQIRLIEQEQQASRPQSILIPAEWSVDRAKAWIKQHGFVVSEPDTTERYHRFRQADPQTFTRLRTIPFGKDGIKAIVGVPKATR